MPYTTLKYTYPSLKETMEKVVKKSFLYENPLSYSIYENAIVYSADVVDNCLVGGVKTNDGNIVKGSGINSFMESLYEFNENKIDFIDEDVIYIGYLISCYGHVITDCLKHVWFVLSEYYNEHKQKPLVFINYGSVKPWHREIFALAGINLDNCILVDKPTKFKSVLVPESSFIDMNEYQSIMDSSHALPFYTKEYLNTIDTIIDNAKKKSTIKSIKKIFFTRKSPKKDVWTRAEQYGEDIVCKYVKKAGFTVIAPQEYSVAEQISFLQGCDVFMTTDGSIAHNAIFLKNHAVTVILRKNIHVNSYTSAIVDARSLKATIIDCSLSVINNDISNVLGGPFFIYTNAFLSDYLGVKRPIFPFRRFKKYYRNLFEFDDVVERLLVNEDYRSIMAEEIQYANKVMQNRLRSVIPFSNSILGKKLIKRLIRYFFYNAMG